ncbi:MAG: hypothetical protein J5I98_07160, partial [Phaeodactylibacter sp.]|nr:hypothetical protein [Phaeodactylibacter sp.]
MAVSDRNMLKGFFKAREIPRERHFRSLIDSALNKAEDGIRKEAETGLEVQAASEEGGKRDAIRLYEQLDQPVLLQPALVSHFETGDANTFLRILYTGQGSPTVSVVEGPTGFTAIGDELAINFQGSSNSIPAADFQTAIDAFSSNVFSVELIIDPSGSGTIITPSNTAQLLTLSPIHFTRLSTSIADDDFLEAIYAGSAEKPGVVIKQFDSMLSDVGFEVTDGQLTIKIKDNPIGVDTIISNWTDRDGFSLQRIGTTPEATISASAYWKLALVDEDNSGPSTVPAGLLFGDAANGHLFLQAGGNIGIGTMNPAVALEVSAAIKAGSLETTGNVKAGSIEVGGIANLETTISGIEALPGQITALEGRVTPLEALPGQITALEGRVTPLETIPGQVTALEGRITPLETLPGQVTALEGRVTALETLPGQVTALEGRVTPLETRPGKVTAMDVGVAPLETRPKHVTARDGERAQRA